MLLLRWQIEISEAKEFSEELIMNELYPKKVRFNSMSFCGKV